MKKLKSFDAMRRLAIIALALICMSAITACRDPIAFEFAPMTPVTGENRITSVYITITAPVKDATPATTASGADNFDVGAVSWSPTHNPFQGGVVYTATVTLTAETGYTFDRLTSAIITGQIAQMSNNTGEAVTLSLAFPATGTKAVTNMAITTQPANLTYTHGDTLDLTGLAVMLTYDDASTEVVAAADFAANNITAVPGQNTTLVYSTHNGQPVTITHGSFTQTTNNLTVNPKAITSAQIAIVPPAKNAAPDTTATGAGNFDVGAVSWSPTHNPFQGGEIYTASVTLTANSGYTFTGLSSPTINGQNATMSNNTGEAVTLSYEFPATSIKAVTGIAVKAPPSNLTYTHGNTLNLAGLVVTLTYDDATAEDVPVANFAANNITATPADGVTLVHTTHNGQPVEITGGGFTCSTNPLNPLTVNPKVITFNVDAIAAQTYNGSPHTPPVTVKDGTTTLTPGTDYTVGYTNNTNAGTATATITGEDNYAGSSGSRTFTINSKSITFTVDEIPAQTYTGSAITPTVTVKDDLGRTLTLTADYTVAYGNNIDRGTATVTITGAGNYAGSTGSATFEIVDHEHDWGWVVTTAPTITTDGVETGTCKTNSSHTTTRVLHHTGTPGLEFTLISGGTNNGTYRVRSGTVDSGAVVIPRYWRPVGSNYEAYQPVREIGADNEPWTSGGAFREKNITSVQISETVTSIGSGAFWECTSLTSVTIPTNSQLQTISGAAFFFCGNLTGITIPAGVTSIGQSAFSNCTSLTGITIPNSVTSIGSSAFERCSGLETVTFAAGSQLTTIGGFSNCTSLTGITIPAGVTSIGSDAFWACTSLASVTFPTDSQLQTIGDWAFRNCTSLTNVTIPARVTSIGYAAFLDCTSFVSIDIPAGVTSIGGGAFNGCTSLTTITFPTDSQLQTIGGGAFRNCTSLTNVTIPARVTSIGEDVFGSCQNLAVIFAEGRISIRVSFKSSAAITSVYIPASVTTIDNETFYGCTNLAGVTFATGNQLLTIGSSVFNGCTSLASITIPNSVTEIGNSAFRGCTSLANITIPTSVKVIRDLAFFGCTSLTSITIPNSVTSIGRAVFGSCTSLAAITVDGGNTVYASQDGILYNKAKTSLILAPLRISGNVTIPAGVTSIDSNAFSDCTNLASITIPAGVTEIGASAFRGCTSLASITIPAGVTEIGAATFYGCNSLTSVTIPAGVTSIGHSAFRGCNSLTSVTIPAGVTSIDLETFFMCTSLTSVTIPAGVTSIGQYAFYACTSLTSITIPAGVTEIGQGAFSSCTSLTGSITIPNSVTSISEQAFSGCTRLTSITIPAGVTEIGDNAFANWTASQTIYVPFAQGQTPSGWELWDYNCNAQIIYQP